MISSQSQKFELDLLGMSFRERSGITKNLNWSRSNTYDNVGDRYNVKNSNEHASHADRHLLVSTSKKTRLLSSNNHNLRFQSLIGLTPERKVDYFFCM